MKKSRLLGAVCACIFTFSLSTSANAATIYSNGFETDTSGWFTPTRVVSGTGGIPSSAGSYYATTGTDYTDWGGYNYGAGNAVATVFKEYTTSLDIYLDVAGGWANDTRFDFTSAINNNLGTHLRDFAFNAGFYDSTDTGSPGSGIDRFVFSASTTTGRVNSYPMNPGRDPIAIDTTGWYTFQHRFYNDGGVLAVDLSIFDSSSSLIHMWTLSASDAIADVGGNRYGWFANNEFGLLAIDNTSLSTSAVPVPAAVWLFGSGLLGLVGISRRKKTA